MNSADLFTSITSQQTIWSSTDLQSHFQHWNSLILQILWISSVSERPCDLMIWHLSSKLKRHLFKLNQRHSTSFSTLWVKKVCLHFLSHCCWNRLRKCVKLSALFPYLSDSELYRGFRNMRSLLGQTVCYR